MVLICHVLMDFGPTTTWPLETKASGNKRNPTQKGVPRQKPQLHATACLRVTRHLVAKQQGPPALEDASSLAGAELLLCLRGVSWPAPQGHHIGHLTARLRGNTRGQGCVHVPGRLLRRVHRQIHPMLGEELGDARHRGVPWN